MRISRVKGFPGPAGFIVGPKCESRFAELNWPVSSYLSGPGIGRTPCQTRPCSSCRRRQHPPPSIAGQPWHQTDSCNLRRQQHKRRFATTQSKKSALLSIREAAVVGKSRVQRRSLTATGTPWSGPLLEPVYAERASGERHQLPPAGTSE